MEFIPYLGEGYRQTAEQVSVQAIHASFVIAVTLVRTAEVLLPGEQRGPTKKEWAKRAMQDLFSRTVNVALAQDYVLQDVLIEAAWAAVNPTKAYAGVVNLGNIGESNG